MTNGISVVTMLAWIYKSIIKASIKVLVFIIMNAKR